MTAMFAPPSLPRAITRRVASLVLVLWLAGVGCIIGCEMNAAAAHTEETQTVSEGESCSATSAHDCCHKEGNDAPTSVALPETGTDLSCCPLAAVSTESSRKISTKDIPVAVAGGQSTVPADSRTSTSLPSHQLRVPDRGSTHLRCCVFLI